MSEDDWAKMAVYLWRSAYIAFFIGAYLLIKNKKTLGRWLFFIGILLLLIVNISMLAVAHDVINLVYNPYFESETWNSYGYDGIEYPQWQRTFYWATALFDILGKSLAGIGLIIEGRSQVMALHRQQMQQYQSHPSSN